MRTVEVLFVIVILLTAFAITTQFAVLPSPSEAFGTNLRGLSQSTLEILDAKGVLSETVFKDISDPAWAELQKALSASLPLNVVYNMSVYDLSENSEGVVTYELVHSISDASLGANSEAVSSLVTSPDVTFTQDPQKVGESTGQNITLYILNCSDANGWWVTGYTGQTLATEFYNFLSPYFTTTVLINTTAQLGSLLDGTFSEGNIQNAVVINTFGEAVPIPSSYAANYSGDLAEYCYVLGQKVNNYNWNWVSIVGYPFYYVTNVNYFSSVDNGWGIYGMEDDNVKQAGLNAFLQGLNDVPYSHNSNGITKAVNVVYFSSEALELFNYYGVYPNDYQTSSRALSKSVLLDTYGLSATELFTRPSSDPNYIPAATYTNSEGGAFTAVGLTRTPDARVAVIGLLMYYHPTIYKSVFGAGSTTRLVTLQLSQQGGA